MPTIQANNLPPHGDQETPLPVLNRRGFLKHGSRALGASLATLVLCDLADLMQFAQAAGLTPQSGESVLGGYDWTKHRYVYLIDLRKCIGCGACVRACAKENNVPRNYFRTWVERYEVSRTGEEVVDSTNGGMDGFAPHVSGNDVTKAFFFPKLCCHCTYTPCVQLCPVGASYRTLEGVVLVDEKRCIGCGYCVQACPYGSRFIHPVTHTASKCSLCYHRLTRGLTTACVQACPVKARMLGDTIKVGDEVAEIIATQSVRTLQPELLTDPNCFYLGLSKEAR
jgi:Fe-S-cluster-containing dehydrogenase component